MMHEELKEEREFMPPEPTTAERAAQDARADLSRVGENAKARRSFEESERTELYIKMQAIMVEKLLQDDVIKGEMDYFIGTGAPAAAFRKAWDSAAETGGKETVGERVERLLLDEGVDDAAAYVYEALRKELPEAPDRLAA